MTSKEIALALAEAAVQKKGQDICILDLHEIASFADFFVIVTGTSKRHVRTLADAALDWAHACQIRPLGMEGEDTARWILLDLGDVLVHVFEQEARDFYSLERLWGEAPALTPRKALGVSA